MRRRGPDCIFELIKEVLLRVILVLLVNLQSTEVRRVVQIIVAKTVGIGRTCVRVCILNGQPELLTLGNVFSVDGPACEIESGLAAIWGSHIPQ